MTIETTAKPSKTKRIILLILLGFLLLILLWLGLKTWRIYQTGQALLARKAEVETLMADGFLSIEPDKAESLILDTRENIQTLKQETAVFMPLTPYLGWVPKIGSTLVIAPELVTMADSGIDTAAYAVRGLKPALAILQDDTNSDKSMIGQLSGVLVDAVPDLVAANEKLAEVASARALITNEKELPYRVQSLFALADEWLPFAQDALTVTAVLPEMLGENGSRTYLIMAQNEDELRPTGGYISGAGTMVVNNGEIASLEMVDAFQIDNWREKPYDFPPQPLYDYMGFDLFLFRDSNFWPDFPTSAEKAMDLYSYGQDLPPLDGVIAIDQEFLRLLVEATGAITIPESNVTITPKNTIETLQNAWGERSTDDTKWVGNRKAFIGIFASTIIDYIQSNFSEIDPLAFAQNMNRAVTEKHLQIYMRNPNANTILDQINWNGRLENPNAQDFLAVIDTNMGFNKVNLHIDRTIDYHITLNGEGSGKVSLAITYTHTSKGPAPECSHYNFDVYAEGGSYLDLAENCYWNYQRVYVPEGSQLISASDHPVPAEFMRSGQPINTVTNSFTEQAGLTTFDNFLVVPYGQSLVSEYVYSLPIVTISNENNINQYQLTLHKQASTTPESASISITLPKGVQFLDASLEPSIIEGQTILFDIILDADKTITLTYQ